MIIGPQHLQAWERHLEVESWRRLQMLSLRGAGVAQLEFDALALNEGRVVPRALVALLPDGTLVDSGQAEPPTALIPSGTRASRLPVMLCVAKHDPMQRNISMDEDAGRAIQRRYRPRQLELHDTFSDAGSVTVDCAQLQLTLDLGDVVEDRLSVLKIAELVRSATGAWTFAQDFIPPVYAIRAAAGLVDIMERIRGRMASHRSELLGRRSEFVHAALTANGVQLLLTLDALGQAIAHLDHLTTAPGATPESAFGSLIEFAGRLSTFNERVAPENLPRFRRDDLFGSFTELDAVFAELLGQSLPSRFVRLAFAATGVNRWDCDVPGGLMTGEHELWLLLDGQSVEQVAASQLLGALKLAAPENLDFLVRRRRMGLAVQTVDQPPPGVAVPPSARLLRLMTVGEEWREMKRASAVSVHVPPPLHPESVELLALPVGGA